MSRQMFCQKQEVEVGKRVKSIYCESEQNHGFVRKACYCHMQYAFLRHIIFSTTREMITHFDTLQEIFTHFWHVARGFTRFFDLSRQSGSTRFVRKVFAREKPLSGKFYVFVSLGATNESCKARKSSGNIWCFFLEKSKMRFLRSISFSLIEVWFGRKTVIFEFC